MQTKLRPLRCGVVSMALLVGLAACGGGSDTEATKSAAFTEIPASVVTGVENSEDLPKGISKTALEPDYGVPRSKAEISAAARTLSGYFNGRYAGQPESLMGEKSTQVAPKAAPNPQAVYRFLNTLTGVHFYTISTAERDNVVATLPMFSLEGTAFFALQSPSAALSPVYRFYNRVTGTHFYTINEAEREDVATRLSAIYQFEGVSWYGSTSSGPGWSPIHRFFNRATGNHFYTASEAERLNVIATLPTFTYEGIGYYIRANSGPFLSGNVVVNGPIRNAVVCLDLNGNDVCDAGEPASQRTTANGVYMISFPRSQVSEQEQAAASLIARMVPGDASDINTTIDEGFAQPVTETPFVLRLAPDLAGQINPLSSLVAVGIASGMTEAQARSNVAYQLAIPVNKIDNYLDDPVVSDDVVLDNARSMATVVSAALQSPDVVLAVGNQAAAVEAAPNDLRSLRYVDVNNFNYLEFSILAKPQGQLGMSVLDTRAGRSEGVAISEDSLYNQAYLAPAGWTRCERTEQLTVTLGSPSRAVFCNAAHSISYRQIVNENTSVAGRPMAEVVSELQLDQFNVINQGVSTVQLNAALGAAAFPAGSAVRRGFTLQLNQPIYINSINTDGFFDGPDVNLDTIIEWHPSTDANANLPSASGKLSLGLGSGNLKNLRVAFNSTSSPTTGSVQFYECDLNPELTQATNCAATQTGTYSIAVVNGVRVMSFAGNAPTIMNHERLYVEVNANNQANGVIGGTNWVFTARRLKPDFGSNSSASTRPNGVAWQAMKTQLGL